MDPSVPTIEDLMAFLATNAAEVATLEVDRGAFARRILKLEEELALALLPQLPDLTEVVPPSWTVGG
jgi:hypothetical protein